MKCEKSLNANILMEPFEVLLVLFQPANAQWSPLKSFVLPNSLLLSLHRRKHFLRYLFIFTVLHCFCGTLNGRNSFEHLCVRHASILENILSSLDNVPSENITTTCNFLFSFGLNNL